jgi:hypothetical protein
MGETELIRTQEIFDIDHVQMILGFLKNAILFRNFSNIV